MRERVAAVVGAELHANVADVRPFLGRGGVMAVPLRIGGGSRLKILEALATGMPVVSTRVGAEGLKLEPERDLIAVETVEQMASALLRCLREPLLARSMAVHGRRTVLDQYDWDVLALKLQEVWERSVRAGCSNKLVASN
jgi:glycosyltransferase involved in cell wall biosynthesis